MSSVEKDRSLPHAPTLQEPSKHQVDRIDREVLAQENALRFAFDLGILRANSIEPNRDFEVDANLLIFQERLYAGGAVLEIVAEPDSKSMGLVLLPEIDLKTVPNRRGGRRDIRLDVDPDGNPHFFQMGTDDIRIALAARASEFLEMHSSEMHAHVEGLLSGQIPHVKRPTIRDRVLEEALGMTLDEQRSGELKPWERATRVITTKELAYVRQYTKDQSLSRRVAGSSGTLLLGPDKVVSSVFALGGMPPVTGSLDTIVTASMSYMRSWIPRNGVFSGDFERQLGLFEEAKARIKSYGLPPNIEANAIALIGISVGSENPQEIAENVRRFKEAGGHAVRIYTTNPDSRVVETAKAARKVSDELLIAVGPVVSAEQARVLLEEAYVQEDLIGHGGGENCTSLDGGGAANSLEILYELYLDPRFEDSIIGLEGGTGTSFGALLPMLDVISANRRGVGGIESTGGLYTSRKDLPVLPYHGTASAPTKLIEYYMRKDKDPLGARRIVGPDGAVLHVEGKPNYTQMRDSAKSNVMRYRELRELCGRIIADQKATSIYELRRVISERGEYDHRIPTLDASEIAAEHRASLG